MLKFDWLHRESRLSSESKNRTKTEELVEVLANAPYKVFKTNFVKTLAGSVW